MDSLNTYSKTSTFKVYVLIDLFFSPLSFIHSSSASKVLVSIYLTIFFILYYHHFCSLLYLSITTLGTNYEIYFSKIKWSREACTPFYYLALLSLCGDWFPDAFYFLAMIAFFRLPVESFRLYKYLKAYKYAYIQAEATWFIQIWIRMK